MAVINTNLTCDLQHAVRVQYLDGNIFSQDNQGNVINVTVFDGGEPATLSGAISANIIRADGGTVAATGGTITDNVASIILPAAAYAIPGVVSIVIKNTNSSVVTTIAAIVANVYQSSTDTVVDPGTIIPSVQTLISVIETAVASIPADYSSLWTSLAPAFNSSANYVTGQYVTYNGGLYRFTTAHSGTWSSSDVVAVNIGGDLSDLKSALDKSSEEVGIITGNTPITFVSGYYAYSNSAQNVAFVPTAYSGRACALFPCNEGDVFIVTIAGGGTSFKAWGFSDASGNVLSASSNNVTLNNKKIGPAPTGSKYLVLNTKTDNNYFAVKGTEYFINQFNRVTGNLFSLDSVEPISFTEGKYINTSGLDVEVSYTPVSNSNLAYAIVNCVAGDYFTLNAKGWTNARLWAFIDADDIIIAHAAESTEAENLIIQAPIGAVKCILNTYISDMGFTYKGRKTDLKLNVIADKNQYDYEKTINEDGLYLHADWLSGNLDASGAYQEYDGRICTYSALKFKRDIVISNDSNVSFTVCTYEADETTLVSRKYYSSTTSVQIAKNTPFRISLVPKTGYSPTSVLEFSSHITIKAYKEQEIDEQIIPNLITVFESFAVIGDSLSCGFVSDGAGHSYNSNTARNAHRNWPSYLGLSIGREFTNLARGSSKVKDWRYGSQSLDVDISTADIDTYCYMVALGVNDARNNLTVGSEEDIETDMDQNADSFYGNYDWVIRKLIQYKTARLSQAKIFVMTIPSTESNAESYNEAIRYVASLYADVYCIDIYNMYYENFINPPFSTVWVGSHSRPIGYAMMADWIRKGVNLYMFTNPSSFAYSPWMPLS